MFIIYWRSGHVGHVSYHLKVTLFRQAMAAQHRIWLQRAQRFQRSLLKVWTDDEQPCLSFKIPGSRKFRWATETKEEGINTNVRQNILFSNQVHPVWFKIDQLHNNTKTSVIIQHTKHLGFFHIFFLEPQNKAESKLKSYTGCCILTMSKTMQYRVWSFTSSLGLSIIIWKQSLSDRL